MANVKRIKKTKLCIGDKTHLVNIQTRGLGASDLDDTQPKETFTTVRSQWCAIETVGFPNSGVARFDGINIEEGATHLFWTDYDVTFPDVENRNHFVSYDGKYYKILRVDNLNERNESLAIQTTERGATTLGASEA